MSNLRHPNIVRFLGACLEPLQMSILFELCATYTYYGYTYYGYTYYGYISTYYSDTVRHSRYGHSKYSRSSSSCAPTSLSHNAD